MYICLNTSLHWEHVLLWVQVYNLTRRGWKKEGEGCTQIDAVNCCGLSEHSSNEEKNLTPGSKYFTPYSGLHKSLFYN